MVADTAVDGEHVAVRLLGERCQLVFDLFCEFPRRSQNQRSRLLAFGHVDIGDHRQPERERLPGTGGCLAAHVEPVEGVRDGCGLHRERFDEAAVLERTHEIFGQAEIGKGRCHGVLLVPVGTDRFNGSVSLEPRHRCLADRGRPKRRFNRVREKLS